MLADEGRGGYATFYREVHSVKFTRLVFIYKYIYLRNNNLYLIDNNSLFSPLGKSDHSTV